MRLMVLELGKIVDLLSERKMLDEMLALQSDFLPTFS